MVSRWETRFANYLFNQLFCLTHYFILQQDQIYNGIENEICIDFQNKTYLKEVFQLQDELPTGASQYTYIYLIVLLKEFWKKSLRKAWTIENKSLKRALRKDPTPFSSNLVGNTTYTHLPRPECQLAIVFHSLHIQLLPKASFLNPLKTCLFLLILIYLGYPHLLPELRQTSPYWLPCLHSHDSLQCKHHQVILLLRILWWLSTIYNSLKHLSSKGNSWHERGANWPLDCPCLH